MVSVAGRVEGDAVAAFPYLKYDIIILNWDICNGDPGFGSDIAKDWFDHYRGNIFDWVHSGHCLVIESQVAFQRPLQEAYDAVIGPGQLKIDSVLPVEAASWDRYKSTYYVKANDCLVDAFNHPIFQGVDAISFNDKISNELLFPPRSIDGVTDFVQSEDIEGVVARGWFSTSLQASLLSRPLTWRSLRWWPLVWVRHPKLRHLRHPLLLVCHHGDGLILTSTMWLGRTQATRLLANLISLQAGMRSPGDFSLLKDWEKSRLTAGPWGLMRSALTWALRILPLAPIIFLVFGFSLLGILVVVGAQVALSIAGFALSRTSWIRRIVE